MSEAKDKDDLPIGKMMGDTLRKRINAKPPPKRQGKEQPSKEKESHQTGVRG